MTFREISDTKRGHRVHEVLTRRPLFLTIELLKTQVPS